MKKALLTIPLLLYSIFTYAQHQGILVVYAQQKENLYLKIDTMVCKPQEELRLTPGTHKIFIWAPSFKPVSDTVTVVAGKYTHYRASLQYTETYSEKTKENKESYRIIKNATIVTAGFAFASIVLNSTLYLSYKKATRARQDYEDAVSLEDIEYYRMEHENSKNNFNKIKKFRNISYIGLASSAAIGGIWGLLHFKQHHRPYSPEKNPWLEAFVPSYDLFNGQFNLQFLITLK